MVIRGRGADFEYEVTDARVRKRIRKAQAKLCSAILADCTPYVPFGNGDLRSSGHIIDNEYIEWNTPYAHYQAMGVQYIDPKLGVSGIYSDGYGWWSHPKTTKIKTDKPLNYTQAGTTDHWFDYAKKEHKREWLKLSARISGGEVDA